MGLKEKMMEDMMNKMSGEERLEMMNKMMESFMSNISTEERQKIMNSMMDKFFTNSSNEGMPDMMHKMMGGKRGKGFSMGGGMMNMMNMMMGNMGTKEEEGQESPWDMCKKMMSTMNENFEIAKFATPELRTLFDEWIQQIMEEILKYIEETKSIDSEKIAEHFKISTDSVNFILSKLAKDGKIILNANKK